MTLDLSDQETDALARLLRRTIDDDHYPLSPRVQTLKAILAKIQPEPDAGAVAAVQAIRAAACDDGQEAPLGALTLKSEPGLPMTLRRASVPALASSYGAGIAAVRSSPVPRRWLLGTVPKRRLSIGAGGGSRCGSRRIEMVVSGTKRRRE
jgi:hypothetical protein